MIVVALAAVLLVTWRQWWSQVWTYLVDLDILSATGILAILAAITALGGYATIRRITV